MLPRVIVSVGASVDGRTVGVAADPTDMGLYYELVGRWSPDVHLSGSETLAVAGFGAEPDLAPDWRPPEPLPGDPRALLVVVDSGGKIRNWPGLWAAGYWRGMMALCSAATPAEHLAHLARCGVESIVAGERHVDLRAALEALAERLGPERSM
jgi:2,5-diamino-6-(ribosylamino)-4(3H)-pyrimidinone 5'-phosphate reductase